MRRQTMVERFNTAYQALQTAADNMEFLGQAMQEVNNTGSNNMMALREASFTLHKVHESLANITPVLETNVMGLNPLQQIDKVIQMIDAIQQGG